MCHTSDISRCVEHGSYNEVTPKQRGDFSQTFACRGMERSVYLHVTAAGPNPPGLHVISRRNRRNMWRRDRIHKVQGGISTRTDWKQCGVSLTAALRLGGDRVCDRVWREFHLGKVARAIVLVHLPKLVDVI